LRLTGPQLEPLASVLWQCSHKGWSGVILNDFVTADHDVVLHVFTPWGEFFITKGGNFKTREEVDGASK
jgi:hypothetical protein